MSIASDKFVDLALRRVAEGKPVFFWSLPCFSGDQKKLGGRIGVPREGSPKPRR